MNVYIYMLMYINTILFINVYLNFHQNVYLNVCMNAFMIFYKISKQGLRRTRKLRQCTNWKKIFEYVNWPRLQIKRTGPSSWSVQLVRPAVLSSWSFQLVHPIGPSGWSIKLVCLAFVAKYMCCKVQKMRCQATEFYTLNLMHCIWHTEFYSLNLMHCIWHIA